MINIRSITYNLPSTFNDKCFETIKNIKNDLKNYKYFIRTQRISTTVIDKPQSTNYYDGLSNFCLSNNIRWFCVPISPINNDLLEYGYNLLKRYDQVFINIDCVKNNIINLEMLNNSINLTKKVAKLSKDGKDNFRLGISINILDDTPFFPFAKSSGDFSFSIALELTQEINRIIKANRKKSLNELRNVIINTIDKQVSEIELTTLEIEKKFGIKFKGFDFSLAPIIEENGSIFTILNHFGIDDFSKSGVLFATAYITNILKSFGKNHRMVGFSGVMYSLLEDLELSKINNTEGIRLEDLIKLSTMCGCGIDMIPIDINTNNEYIKTAILDVYGISCKLNKPLGVRFLPVQESFTKFTDDQDFICNTKVLNISGNKITNICDKF